jgi:hypothetical protein
MELLCEECRRSIEFNEAELTPKSEAEARDAG